METNVTICALVVFAICYIVRLWFTHQPFISANEFANLRHRLNEAEKEIEQLKAEKKS